MFLKKELLQNNEMNAKVMRKIITLLIVLMVIVIGFLSGCVSQSKFTLHPTDDVDSGYLGSSDTLYVAYEVYYDEDSVTFTRLISLLKFDLSEIPSDKIIKNATLKVYCYMMPNDPALVKVHRSTNISWNETNILSPSDLPDYTLLSSDEVLVENSGYPPQRWYEWDVKNYTQNALSSRKITLVLDTDIGSDYGRIAFYSKESSYNPPQLIVNLE